MRVLVTGGTGFIGRALVRSLCERGDDVVVLTRGREGHSHPPGPRPSCFRGAGKVELATWEPDHAGAWFSAVEGVDAVIHLAGAGVFDERWTTERKAILRSSRVRSTELLAEAIVGARAKPKVFVSGSAMGYYGVDAADRVLTEEDPPGSDFLARLCADWEAAASAARRAGVRVCHPRFGIVLGRNGGALAKMLPAFRAFVGGPVGSGAQYLGWIHLVDAVRALEHAIDSTLEGPFNVTAPEPVTMTSFAEHLAGALDRPAAVRVPSFVVRLAFGARAETVLTGQRAVPKKLVGDGFAFVFPELTSALADIVANERR